MTWPQGYRGHAGTDHIMAIKKIDPELQELIDQFGGYMTYPQAAKHFGVHPKTLHRLTARGELPCYTIGRSRAMRVRTADVFSLLRRVA